MAHARGGTHFRGPLSGSASAGDGLWNGVSIGALQPEDWSILINEFRPIESIDRSDGAATTAPNTADFNEVLIGAGGTWTFSGNSPGDVGTTVIRPGAQNAGLIVRTTATYAAFQTNTVDKTLAWSCRFKVEDLTNQHFYVGLGGESATFMDATGALAAVNRAGFHHLTSDGTSIDLVTRFNGGLELTTSAAFTMTDDRFVTVGIRFEDDPDKTTNASIVSYYLKENGMITNTERTFPWRHLATHVSAADNFNGNLQAQWANVSTDTGFANDELWLDYMIWAHTRDLES